MKIDWEPIYEFTETPPGPMSNWALHELAKELVRLKVNVNVHALGIPDVHHDGG